MATFTTNIERLDPYKNYKFRISWDGRHVAGVSKISALKRTTEVVEHREGGDPSTPKKSPGMHKFEGITCERGVTHDKAFENWANKVWNYSTTTGEESSLKDFRKDLKLEIYNEAGQLAMAYDIFRAWISEFQQTGELDANGNAILFEMIKIEHEGFQRDNDVGEPAEVSFGAAGDG